MATFRNQSFARMVEQTLKKTASALRDNDIPFCLIGSLSAWVRGGPESSHDLDFGIKPEDIMRTVMALEDVGMRIELPTEDWLFKAYDSEDNHETMIDLIYAPSGMIITDEVIARADMMDVLAQKMPILNATDLMTMKLLSLREQNLNFTSTISTARSIREQIDWSLLYKRTRQSPYSNGFFTMATELGIIPEDFKKAEEDNTALSDMQKIALSSQDYSQERKHLINHLQQSSQ